MKKYLVIFEKMEDGYGACVPDLPGLGITGKTKAEAEQLIYEGIQFHIEALMEDGLLVPEPITEGEMLLVPA